MPSFNEKRLVPYTPQQMYRLVADVKAYPEFVPWCKALNVTKESCKALEAQMTLVLASYETTFASHVLLTPHERIEIKNASPQNDEDIGPLRSLQSVWTFRPCKGGQCEITFSITAELRNSLLHPFLAMAMDTAGGEMVKAFEERAANCYASSKNDGETQGPPHGESAS
jgi:coenzyme Q-binding protein COQ10